MKTIAFILLVFSFYSTECSDNNSEIKFLIQSNNDIAKTTESNININVVIKNDRTPMDFYNFNVAGVNWIIEDTLRKKLPTGIYISILDEEQNYVTSNLVSGFPAIPDSIAEDIVIDNNLDAGNNEKFWSYKKNIIDSTVKLFRNEFMKDKLHLDSYEIYKKTIKINLKHFDLKKGIYFLNIIYIGNKNQIENIQKNVEQKLSNNYFVGKLVSNRIKIKVEKI